MDVKIIRRNGDAVLVEYATEEEGTRRVVIPRDKLDGTEAEKETLDMGLPFGVEWEALLNAILPDKQEIVARMARRLRDAGMWSEDDLKANNLASALQASFAVDAAAIMRKLREGIY